MLYCEGGAQCLCSQLAYEVDILVCTQIKEIKKPIVVSLLALV